MGVASVLRDEQLELELGDMQLGRGIYGGFSGEGLRRLIGRVDDADGVQRPVERNLVASLDPLRARAGCLPLQR